MNIHKTHEVKDESYLVVETMLTTKIESIRRRIDLNNAIKQINNDLTNDDSDMDLIDTGNENGNEKKSVDKNNSIDNTKKIKDDLDEKPSIFKKLKGIYNSKKLNNLISIHFYIFKISSFYFIIRCYD